MIEGGNLNSDHVSSFNDSPAMEREEGKNREKKEKQNKDVQEKEGANQIAPKAERHLLVGCVRAEEVGEIPSAGWEETESKRSRFFASFAQF